MGFKSSLKAGLTAGFTCLILLANGCKKQSAASPNAAQNSKQPDATSTITQNSTPDQADASEVHLIVETEAKERADFQANVIALARKEDFKELESQAENFRVNKSRFKNGYWKLRAFYMAFGVLPKNAEDDDWLDLVAKVQKWAKQYPDATAPRIALAETYRGYAWFARGGGWANTVTDENARLMDERLQKSLACLTEAKKKMQNDADYGFYAVMLRVCLGVDITRARYEEIFEAGIKEAPEFSPLYEYKSYYLLPRWHGEPGEWEAFAREMSKRQDLTDSAEIFARCAIYLREMGMFYDEFSDDDTSWEELKASFHAIEKNYPDSLEIKSILCAMATKFGDYKEAREQMKLINGEVDLNAWGSRQHYLKVVAWLNKNDSTLAGARAFYKGSRKK